MTLPWVLPGLRTPARGCGVAGRTHERPCHGQSAEDTSDTKPPLSSRALGLYVDVWARGRDLEGPPSSLTPLLFLYSVHHRPRELLPILGAFGLAYFLSLERKQSLQAPVSVSNLRRLSAPSLRGQGRGVCPLQNPGAGTGDTERTLRGITAAHGPSFQLRFIEKSFW